MEAVDVSSFGALIDCEIETEEHGFTERIREHMRHWDTSSPLANRPVLTVLSKRQWSFQELPDEAQPLVLDPNLRTVKIVW